jgi:hypothetical protein
MISFGEKHVFLQLSLIHIFGKNEPFSTLKIMIFRKYTFQKLTQFSLRNNALDVPASNTDIVLSRDTSVPST